MRYFNCNADRRKYWNEMLFHHPYDQVELAFSALPSETQMVLLLHYGEEYKFRDIAMLMHLSESVVRNHHSNGIYDLYRYFNPRVPGELFH